MSESLDWTELDSRVVDTARVLAADAVHKTGNGHPGTAMSLAPASTLLFQRILRHDPSDPNWIGRDRFVLSAGHSSLTLYIQLFFSGYGLELNDIEAFRTEDSLTPGHPEYGHTTGVEVTTGPLGQGISNAVGMAMDTRYICGLLDAGASPGESPFDHHIYVIAGDGCMEEGISSEASSLAGTQKLGNLIVLYDDNHISIEGNTDVAFTEDVLKRYEAYGWQTLHTDLLPNGSIDLNAVNDALAEAKSDIYRPTIIRMRSIIGWPAPKLQNTGKAHGADLGAEEVGAVKEILGFDPDKSFEVSDEVLAHAREVVGRGKEAHEQWDLRYQEWRSKHAERAALLDRLLADKLPANFDAAVPVFETGISVATRVASGKVINSLAAVLPEFWGGSADLAGSNNTSIEGGMSFEPEGSPVPDSSPYGRIIHFGVREHGMGAILNGIAVGGLSKIYGGTFFTFADYMRGAVRVGSLMNIPVTYVWTHDSVGLGEDGPTHQPVEHLTAYRAIPNLHIVRPADANETAVAWKTIIENRRPAGLVLSRQGLPTYDQNPDVARGAYVRVEASNGEPKVLILATGSEVQLGVGAAAELESQGIATRVVSMPCFEWFDEQDEAYREAIIPSSVKARVSVEAGLATPWYRLIGDAGRAVSLEHYGASADGALLMKEFGFTVDNVVKAAKESLQAAE
ncbi:MAG: transketolase [Candidatus Nanopelagicales bacterium]